MGCALLTALAAPAHTTMQVHAQLKPAPLPKSAAEARAPATAPLDVWFHGALATAVTGSLATCARVARA